MTSVLKLSEVVDVVIGVDTHVQTHAAAAVDARTGGVLAQITIEATGEGYAELVEFADQVAEEHGALRAWAIEGTASHGRGLAVHLSGAEEFVIELDRPERAARRGGVKSDPTDAIRAAREALARARLATPRGGGPDPDHAATRQALATRLAIRRSAVQAASDARRQLFSAVLTAPEPVRARLRGLKAKALIAKAASLRTTAAWANVDVETATTVACLKTWAQRIQALTAEAEAHERQIRALVRSWRPDLLAQPGVGPIVAATVLCAWGYAGRIHSEAAFAKLAGTSPIEATSGQIHTRHRLNPYGDRRLNCALHTIAITRQRHDPATRAYTERRTREGKNPREIRRCLKRYIARDLYRLLENPRKGLDAT
ncbi:transposase [Nocardioides massiliensis]|uniref:Transposase n=1 Tax=Nocardioides massiliensis TaxID=1325935 RepID=A0ABT9NUH2_9ACTN|nr:transposase [Nocardioides massiliensis]MDP9823799.1 transposase [Nocardioides massiliensis]